MRLSTNAAIMAGVDVFGLLLCSANLPEPQREVAGLVPGRKFRVDYFWPPHQMQHGRWAGLVVEQDGGVFARGKSGHSSPGGILRDMEKSNLLQLEGYLVLRFTPEQLVGPAIGVLRGILRTDTA